MNQQFIDIEDRIKHIKRLHTDEDVAKWIGLKKSNYSRRKKRGSIPYDEIKKVCNREKIPPDYVLFGKGNMNLPEVNHRPDIAAVIHDVADILTSGQGEIIDALVKNVQEFKRATETAKRLSACEIELKDLKDEVSGLKKQIDRLTAPPTGADLKAS